MSLPQGHISGLVIELEPGEMLLRLPGHLTPGDADPFIGGRSDDGLWKCLCHLALTHQGQVVISRLEVLPWDSKVRQLNMQVLKRLPVTRWLTEAHKIITDAEKKAFPGWESGDLPPAHVMLLNSNTPKVGRRGYEDSYYQDIANFYLDFQGSARLRPGFGLHACIAEAMTDRVDRFISPSQIRDAIPKCEKLGYLSPGRGSRMAGPNLQRRNIGGPP